MKTEKDTGFVLFGPISEVEHLYLDRFGKKNDFIWTRELKSEQLN